MLCRNYSRESWRSEDLDRSNEGQHTPQRFMPSPGGVRGGRAKNSNLGRQMRLVGSSFSSSSNGSFHSIDGMSFESMEHPSLGPSPLTLRSDSTSLSVSWCCLYWLHWNNTCTFLGLVSMGPTSLSHRRQWRWGGARREVTLHRKYLRDEFLLK